MSDPLNLSDNKPEAWAPIEETAAPSGNKAESKIPPPPSDIIIRTMESDVSSLALTGGNTPRPQAVSIDTAALMKASGGSSGLRRLAQAIMAIVLIGAAVVGIAYFIYSRFFGAASDSALLPEPSGPSAPAGTPAPAAPPPAAPIVVEPFEHHPFFRKPAEQTIEFFLSGKTSTASDLQTFSQKLTQALSAVKPGTSFVHVYLQNFQRQPMPFWEFLDNAHAPLFNANFLAENFNPDFTFFVYRDQNGFWPGYIAQLKPDKNWLFVTPEITKLESSNALEVLFATSPGNRTGSFQDENIEGQQMRMLNYSNPSAQFSYGWLRSYLIISTSREGVRQALQYF